MTDTKKRGGARRKGTLGWTKDRTRRQPIVTLGDGKTRKRLDPFPRGMSMALMLEKTAHFAEKYAHVMPEKKATSATPAPGSAAAWWDAYFKAREAKGMSPVKPIYNAHLAPALGQKHPQDWTREDCERVVATLDKKIASEGDDRISWKTGANAWALFTKACKVASSAKSASGLRVRADNPCAGVEAPDRGERKQKQWLFPSELSLLLAHKGVPLRWRRLYALLAYTYVRPGELHALDWSDVNLEVGTIHVTKAWDYKRARIKPPKTAAGVRYVPIEAPLLPLLQKLHEESGGKGSVMIMPAVEHWASRFRHHLELAGVKRAELFANTDTHKQITLYDLRATGITWRCLREDYGPRIQQDAGHEKYDTTDGYIRTARVFSGRVGTPFPPLHPSVLGDRSTAITAGGSQTYPEDPGAEPGGSMQDLPGNMGISEVQVPPSALLTRSGERVR